MSTEDTAMQAEAQITQWARASYIMGLLCLTCILWVMLGLPAVICGVIGLVKIRRSGGRLKGTGQAIAGIVIPLVILVIAIVMPPLGTVSPRAKRVVCGIYLKNLGTALTVYASEDDNQLPPEDWCDRLIMEADVFPKSFICPASEEIEGECSYAMNRFAAGKKLDELPGDMVLLFETSIGLKDSPRTTPAELRRFYSAEALGYTASHKVRKDRWNQYGGPGDVLIRHDESKPAGANFLFAGGHTEFVPEDRIAGLKWTAE